MSLDRVLRYSLCVEWLSCKRLPHRDIELSAWDRVLPPQHHRGLLSLQPDADSYRINSSWKNGRTRPWLPLRPFRQPIAGFMSLK